MFYLLTGLISILAISLIFRDKKLPVFIGALASFVVFDGLEVLMNFTGVVIAAYILEQLIPYEYFHKVT